MKTTDLFKSNRSAKRLNESLQKNFGTRINFENFDTTQLEDARNKLRTQMHTARTESGFNENLENDALSKAQFIHDAIVAELMDRQEHIVDNDDEEQSAGFGQDDEEDDEDYYSLPMPNGDRDESINNEGAMDELHADLNDKFNELSPSIEKHKDEAGADNLYNELADIAKAHGAEQEFRRMCNAARHSAHMDYDTNPGGFENWFWYLPLGNENESAPPTAKGERMVKHIKKSYADDGKLTDKEKSIAYATAWKAHNKNESIEQTGDDMRNLREGEIQQASAIVTAKTMVDRVGRWIEELSGMENDTLLTLGDSIRDEMGQDAAKQFISACAPAIQAALENLKSTREALSTSVRALTGEEQPAEMLGAEAPEMAGDEFGGEAEPDAMNEPDLGAEDEFAAAEPAAGGLGDTGREQRESIDRSNSLLRVLAG